VPFVLTYAADRPGCANWHVPVMQRPTPSAAFRDCANSGPPTRWAAMVQRVTGTECPSIIRSGLTQGCFLADRL